MIDETSIAFKLFGLLMFFIIFCGIAYMAYKPSAKKKWESYGKIPLED